MAACGWLGERAFGLGNPAAPVVDFVFQRGLDVAALLALASIVVTLRRRQIGRKEEAARPVGA